MRAFGALLALAAPLASALVISAPPSCGGSRVVIHAGAFFGPPVSLRVGAPAYDVYAPPSNGMRVRRRADDVVHDSVKLADGCEGPFGGVRSSVRGRVVFVGRGRCEFAEKVLRMQGAGAVGVVVVNEARQGEHLANMKLNESGPALEAVRIPSAMISWREWVRLAGCRSSGKLLVQFSPEGEATFDIDYGRDALNTAMMRGMALWILCQCAVNVFRYQRRVGEMRARADVVSRLPAESYSRGKRPGRRKWGNRVGEVDDEGEGDVLLKAGLERVRASGSAGADDSSKSERETEMEVDADMHSDSDMESYADDDDCLASCDGDSPICAVCLDGFSDGERVRRLDCSHMYHAACIDPWLTQSSNCCPICKREVANLPPPPKLLHYASIGG